MPTNTAVIIRSKRYKEDAKKRPEKPLPILQAVDIVQSFQGVKFHAWGALDVNLRIRAKAADRMIRRPVSLPDGVGKTKRVVCFCPDHLIEPAKQAGAIKAGG